MKHFGFRMFNIFQKLGQKVVLTCIYIYVCVITLQKIVLPCLYYTWF